MVASRMTTDNAGTLDLDIQLTEFLNLCLGPAVQLTLQDVNALKNSVSPSVPYVLAKANPDLLIRCFFPQAQLSEFIVEFLQSSEIVFRSEEGIYTYENGISHTSYEIKMGFLELFLLVYYGIYFRKPDTGSINITGEWLNLGEYFTDEYLPTGNLANPKYDMEIIPPRSMNFSLILEVLPQIALIASLFRIDNLEYRLYSVDIGKHDNLQSKIQNTLAALPQNVCVFLQRDSRPQTNQISYLNANTALPYLFDIPDIKPEIDTYVYAARNIIEEFSPEFEKLFQLNNSVVTLLNPSMGDMAVSTSSSSSSSSVVPENKVLKTLYNLFFNLSLFLSPRDRSILQSQAIYKTFAGITANENPSNPLAYWLSNIWLGVESYSLNEQIEKLFRSSLNMIRARATSYWSYDIVKCEISARNWVNLFNCKIMTDTVLPVLKNYKSYNDFSQFLERLPQEHPHFLLDNLMKIATSSYDPLQGIYIRKINFPSIPKYREMLSDELNHQSSGHTILLKVRTATRIINGIPIRLPGNNLQDCSGLVILAPRGSLPVAAFKRQPPSTIFQSIKDNIFGFPTVVQKFQRQSSGKALLSHGDLHRSLVSIHLRFHNLFYDLSRKSFLAMCFMRYAVKYATNVQNQPQMLSEEAISQLRLYISKELDLALNKNHDQLHMYYLSLFDLIVEKAKVNSCSLYDALENYRQYSLANKTIRLKQNTSQRGSLKNPPHQDLLLSSNRSYQNMHVKSVYQPNEAFLQGVRLLAPNQFRSETFTCDLPNYSLEEHIQLNLLLRFGNIPAVYANVYKANGDINIQGIYEAILTHDYIFRYFGQVLSFLTYSEETGQIQIFTSDMFRFTYLVLPPTPLDETELINYVYECLLHLNPNAMTNAVSPLSASTVASLYTVSSPPSAMQLYRQIPHSASADALTVATTRSPVPSVGFDLSPSVSSTPIVTLDYNQREVLTQRNLTRASTASASSSIFRRQDTSDIDRLQLPAPLTVMPQSQRKKRNRTPPATLAMGIHNLFSQSVTTIVDETGRSIHLPDATPAFTISRHS